jgi:hypothetical protein
MKLIYYYLRQAVLKEIKATLKLIGNNIGLFFCWKKVPGKEGETTLWEIPKFHHYLFSKILTASERRFKKLENLL